MKQIIRMIVVWLCFLFAFVIFTSCQKQPTWQEQYDLGMRYLSESNYEEAILAFTAAIEIDPNNALSYVGRAEAYVQMDVTESDTATGSLAAAQADYETALMLDDTLADAYLGLAEVYWRQGFTDEAMLLLEQISATLEDERLTSRLEEMRKVFELTNYIGTNIYDFVEGFPDMRQSGSSDGSIVYENEYLQVSTMYGYGDDTHGIVMVTVQGKCPYTVYGIGYGTSMEDASVIAYEMGGEPWYDETSSKYFDLNEGEALYFSSSDDVHVTSVTYSLDLYAAGMI